MNLKQKTYAFIGAGNMSGAILAGLIKSGVPANNIIATNRSPEKQAKLAQQFGIVTDLSNEQAIEKADVVILGVKPQMMIALLEQLVTNGVSFDNKLVVTVAAGLTVARYRAVLGEVRFIRAMPNTPSMLGLGVTGLFNGSAANLSNIEQDNQLASALFESIGQIVWLDKEEQIDDIAAVSGSGPAYFFLFMETMLEKAIKLGFAPDVAAKMVAQTALGSATMASIATEDFATLRKNVTSPGGSTAEAIKVFEQRQLHNITADALDAAVARAKEMSKL